MKAISLLQPWASLVIMGVKTIETRSWATKHRGSILIHASQGKAGSLFAIEPPFKKYIPDFNALPFGAILGTVCISAMMRMKDLMMTDEWINRLTLEEKAFGDYGEGRYAWMLEDARPFRNAVAARGSLHLWDNPHEGI